MELRIRINGPQDVVRRGLIGLVDSIEGAGWTPLLRSIDGFAALDLAHQDLTDYGTRRDTTISVSVPDFYDDVMECGGTPG